MMAMEKLWPASPTTGTSAQNSLNTPIFAATTKEEVIVYDETTRWIFANGGW